MGVMALSESTRLQARAGSRNSTAIKRDGRTHHVDIALAFNSFEPQSLTSITSTVQQVCIPQAILGTDVICQAKSGLGKTAVFVLTTLQQVDPVPGECSVLVMCHTRELAYQIRNEYNRFSKYMPEIKTGVFYGGTPMQKDVEILANKDTHPHIIVGTPGRLNALVRDKKLRLANIKVFVLDECDKMLDQIGMCPAFPIQACADGFLKTCAATSKIFSGPHQPRSKS